MTDTGLTDPAKVNRETGQQSKPVREAVLSVEEDFQTLKCGETMVDLLCSERRDSQILNNSDSSKDSSKDLQTKDEAFSKLLPTQHVKVAETRTLNRDYLLMGRKIYDCRGSSSGGGIPSNKESTLKESRCRISRETLFCAVGFTALVTGVTLIVVAIMFLNRTACPQSYKVSPATQRIESALYPTQEAVDFDNELPNDVHYIHGERTEIIEKANKSLAVKKNLALSRRVSQSSTATAPDGTLLNATLAVDGYYGDRTARKACSQTNSEAQPYWFVDLGSLYLVSEVRLLTAKDCCKNQLYNFEVRIGQSKHFQHNPLCKHHMGAAVKPKVAITCKQPFYGRYVSIQLLGDRFHPKSRLTLCEVTVHS